MYVHVWVLISIHELGIIYLEILEIQFDNFRIFDSIGNLRFAGP